MSKAKFLTFMFIGGFMLHLPDAYGMKPVDTEVSKKANATNEDFDEWLDKAIEGLPNKSNDNQFRDYVTEIKKRANRQLEQNKQDFEYYNRQMAGNAVPAIYDETVIEKIKFISIPLRGMANNFGCYNTYSTKADQNADKTRKVLNKEVTSDTINYYLLDKHIPIKSKRVFSFARNKNINFIDYMISELEDLKKMLSNEEHKKIVDDMKNLLRIGIRRTIGVTKTNHKITKKTFGIMEILKRLSKRSQKCYDKDDTDIKNLRNSAREVVSKLKLLESASGIVPEKIS